MSIETTYCKEVFAEICTSANAAAARAQQHAGRGRKVRIFESLGYQFGTATLTDDDPPVVDPAVLGDATSDAEAWVVVSWRHR